MAEKDMEEAEAILSEMAKEDTDFAEIERLLTQTGERLAKAETKTDEAAAKLKEVRRNLAGL